MLSNRGYEDIITTINDYSVQYDCMIKPSFWGGRPVSWKALMTRAHLNDKMKVEYMEKKTRTMRQIQCTLDNSLYSFKTIWPEFHTHQYCMKGGFVAQPLIADLTQAEVSKQFSWRFSNIMNRPHVKDKSFVVVTYISPLCPFNKEQMISVGDVIICLNDIDVNKLSSQELVFDKYLSTWDQLESRGDELITICLRDGNVVSATKGEIHDCNSKIEKELKIPLVVK